MALTKTSFSMITGTPVNVLDYGADPTGVADSAAAIRNAFDAVPQTGGGLYFPPGTYSVQSTVIIPRRFVPASNRGPGIHIYGDEATLVGQGAGTGVIFETGQGLYSNGGVSNYNAGNELYKHYGTTIEGLFFQDCGIALKLFNFLERCSVVDCGFRNVHQGILAKRCFYSKYYNLNVKLANDVPQTTAALEFNNENNAISVIGATINGYTDGTLSGCSGVGIKISGSTQAMMVESCSTESLFNGFYVDDDCPGLTIQNNYVSFCTRGFNFNNATRLSVVNNWIGVCNIGAEGVNPQLQWLNNKFDGTATYVSQYDIGGSLGKLYSTTPMDDATSANFSQQDTGWNDPLLPNNAYIGNPTFGYVSTFAGIYAVQAPLTNNGLFQQNFRGLIDWAQTDKIPYCTVTNNTKPSGSTIVIDTSIVVDGTTLLYGNVFFSFALKYAGPTNKAVAGTVKAFNTVFRFDTEAFTVTASVVGSNLRLTIGGLSNDTDIFGRVVLI